MWKTIQKAHQLQKEIEIAVPVSDGMARISTRESKGPWPVPMLVFIRVDRKGWGWQKYYETPAEARADFEAEGRKYDEWKSDMEERKR